MSLETEKSFYCKNCMNELVVEEMGLFLRAYDDSITHFCPNCGFLEMIPASKFEETEEYIKILEEGTDEYHEYPPASRIIKHPDATWTKIHERNLMPLREAMESIGKEIEEIDRKFWEGL